MSSPRDIRQATQPRRGLSREEAAIYIGVGTTTFDRLVAERRMPKPVRIGKRTIWDRLKLDAAFTELGEEGSENQLDRALRMGQQDIEWTKLARDRGAALDRGVDPDTGEPLRRRKRSSRPEGGQGKG